MVSLVAACHLPLLPRNRWSPSRGPCDRPLQPQPAGSFPMPGLCPAVPSAGSLFPLLPPVRNPLFPVLGGPNPQLQGFPPSLRFCGIWVAVPAPASPRPRMGVAGARRAESPERGPGRGLSPPSPR